MNKGYIVKGREDSASLGVAHEAISINEDVPVVCCLYECPCGAQLAVFGVTPIDTTEYKSRCLETTKVLLDERRTTS